MHRRPLARIVTLAVLGVLLPIWAGAGPAAASPVAHAVETAVVAPPHGVWVAQTGADRVRWAWTASPGATSYVVAVSTSPTMSNPAFRRVEGRWVTYTGLKAGTVYYAVVRAVGDSSRSAPSVKSTGIPGAVAKPLGDAVEGADAVAWRWAPYVGAVRYQVWQATSRSGANAKTYTVTGRTITLDVERDSFGYLKVRALGTGGVPLSAWSPIGEAYVPYHPV